MSLLRAMKSELFTVSKHVKHGVNDLLFKNRAENNRCWPTAIIFHGYTYFSSAFNGISLHLEKEEIRTKLWKFDYRKKIEDNAIEITDIINEKYYKQGRKILLAGHSEGGLIVREILSRLPEPENLVKSVVFLGVPHQGTYAAYLNYWVPACKDMIPGSEYLTQLNQKELPSNIPITNIVSSKDECIFPRRNALLPKQGNIENIILDDVGHIGMTERMDLIVGGLKRQIPAYQEHHCSGNQRNNHIII